ncbi:MAG: fluoride efflux transporter CrcB [Ignavibacteriales bacterium]|nr:fluoride efflux transporter CrcB [Ignavibacteriales bacterium]
MIKYLIVSFGAAIGGSLRYWLSNFIYKFLPISFPYGTLSVNLIGSFLVGLFMFYFDEREIISPNIRLFLTVGFCGGFTTFSTFSLETINLLRDSEFLFAGLNIFLNIGLCLAGVYLAYIISK